MGFNNNKQPADLIKSSEWNENFEGLATGDFDYDSNSLAQFRAQLGNYLTGVVWDASSPDLTLNMSAGVAVVSGVYAPVSGITAHAFEASKDTYIDIGVDGVVDFHSVANDAQAPLKEAFHVRAGIIQTDGTHVIGVQQNNRADNRGTSVVYPNINRPDGTPSAVHGLWAPGTHLFKDAIASVPASGFPGFLITGGTAVLSHDASGNSYLTFPAAMPNGLLAVVGSQGDTTAANRAPNFFNYSKDGCSVNYYGLVGPASVRTNYILIGF